MADNWWPNPEYNLQCTEHTQRSAGHVQPLPLLQCTPPTQTYTAEWDDVPNLHLGNLKKINLAQ